MANQPDLKHPSLRIFALLIPTLCIVGRATYSFSALNPPHAVASVAAADGDDLIARNNKQRRQQVDEEIADYALRRLRQEGRNVKTGVTYDVNLPSWTAPLQGAVKACDVMKGKAGSIGRRGLQFNGFNLPKGVHPTMFSSNTITRIQAADDDEIMMNQLLLIYRRINDRDLNFTFYTLPPGYTFVSSIVGIVAYSYSSSHADQIPLNISSLTEVQLMVASTNSASITITVPDLVTSNSATIHGLAQLPRCVSFFSDGSFSFSNLTQLPNICSSSTLTDIALVLALGSNSTTMAHSAPPTGDESGVSSAPTHNDDSGSANITSLLPKSSPRTLQRNHQHYHFIIMVLALGGGIILFTAAITAMVLHCLIHPLFKADLILLGKEDDDEEKEEDKEVFETTRSIGHTRAPTVPSLRTKPSLEVGSLQLPFIKE